MATSGALSTNNEYIKYKITITQNSQSVSNNTSNVTVSVKFYRTNTGYETYGTGTVYCTINGTQYTAAVTSSQKINSSGIVLFSKTLNIAHNSDGTKKLTVSAYIEHQRVTSSSQSYSQTLTTIARKSTLTASNGTLGTAQTLTINRQASSFTHTITYKCGTASGTITTKTTSTSVSFTPPLNLAAQNTTGTSVSITFTITTYSGSTSIGSNTKTITCTIPASVIPTISAFTLTEAVSGLSQFGAFINNKSKIKYAVTAAGVQGSTIKSYSVSIAGQSFTKQTATTAVIETTAGTKSATVKVTDTRGRTASKTVNFTVLNYSPPAFTAISVNRCEADGTLNDDSEYMSFTVKVKCSSLNAKNAVTYTLSYKKSSDSAYSSLNFTLTGYELDGTLIYTSPTFSADYSYDIRFVVNDSLTSITRNLVLSSAKPILDILADGSGAAFFKVASKSGFIEMGAQLFANFGEIPQNAIAIPEGQDLDELLTEGFYMIGNTTASGKILNKPLWLASGDTGTAYVFVGRMGDGLQKFQSYYACTKAAQFIFQRVYYQNTWGDWYAVGGCSGWNNLTVSSGFEVYGTDTEPKYRVNGNLVTVTGTVKPTAAVTSNTTGVTFATGIPERFRPPVALQFVCQGSGINRWLLGVTTGGALTVSRYGTSEYVNIAAGAWLTFTVTYSI